MRLTAYILQVFSIQQLLEFFHWKELMIHNYLMQAMEER